MALTAVISSRKTVRCDSLRCACNEDKTLHSQWNLEEGNGQLYFRNLTVYMTLSEGKTLHSQWNLEEGNGQLYFRNLTVYMTLSEGKTLHSRWK